MNIKFMIKLSLCLSSFALLSSNQVYADNSYFTGDVSEEALLEAFMGKKKETTIDIDSAVNNEGTVRSIYVDETPTVSSDFVEISVSTPQQNDWEVIDETLYVDDSSTKIIDSSRY